MNGLGLPYRAVAPEVEETVPAELAAAQTVAMLAERKARAVAQRYPTGLIIGSDQLVSLSGRALGKPPDAEAAAVELKALRGRTHEICTGVCVVGPGYFVTEVDVARMTVLPLTDREVEAYVALGEWQGCAGGYRIEGRGQALFSRVDGDRTAIQGLPMQWVVRLLREAGVSLF